jgi:hypothetical protein
LITENLSTLKIHKLTQAQYDRELEEGRIDENALYLTPDEEITAEQIGARPDTWIPTASEIGAAPDGFGLGENVLQVVTPSELDSLVGNGWYYVHAQDETLDGITFKYAHLFSVCHGDNKYQELRPIATKYILLRECYNGVWSDWSAKDWSSIMTSANFSYSNGTLSITT